MQGNQRQAVLMAYLAGIIDGEGSFMITKTSIDKMARNTRSKTTRYLAFFSIGMVDREPLDLIIDAIGAGKIYEERVPNARTLYRVRFGGRLKLIPFIKNLLPYLIVKKTRAKIVLDFCEKWITSGRKEHGYREYVSVEELQRREDSYQLMRKLNAVGAAATTKSFSKRELEAIV